MGLCRSAFDFRSVGYGRWFPGHMLQFLDKTSKNIQKEIQYLIEVRDARVTLYPPKSCNKISFIYVSLASSYFYPSKIR
jgi:hypothetical protein